VQGHRDFVIKTILHGLTGENNGRSYSEVMIPMKQDDNWIASVGSYVRNSFGNSASFIMPSDVARVRAMTATRKTQWTVAEINATLPVVLETQSAWTLSASHNSASATRGVDHTGLDVWRSARGRHVVPDRTAAAGAVDRDPVHRTGRPRCRARRPSGRASAGRWPWRARRHATGQHTRNAGRASRGHAWRPRDGTTTGVAGAGLARRQDVESANGRRVIEHADDSLVRAHTRQACSHRPQCTAGSARAELAIQTLRLYEVRAPSTTAR
jgi:hypothetical protein